MPTSFSPFLCFSYQCCLSGGVAVHIRGFLCCIKYCSIKFDSFVDHSCLFVFLSCTFAFFTFDDSVKRHVWVCSVTMGKNLMGSVFLLFSHSHSTLTFQSPVELLGWSYSFQWIWRNHPSQYQLYFAPTCMY